MSSDKKNDVATQKVEDDKSEAKSDISPHKRTASEVNSAEDGEVVKQKIQKTDHKGEKDKENGESEDNNKFDDGDDDDDDDEVVPEADDFEEEGDDDVVEEEGDDDDEDDA